MIASLTKKQEENIPIIKDKWLDLFFGNLGKPIDKEQARKGIEWMYNLAGFQKPKIMFFESPMALQIVANLLKQNIEENIEQNIWQNIEQNIEQNIWQNIKENIEENIKENIWQNIRQNIWQNIEQNIWKNIEENIEENIKENIKENIEQNIRQNIWQNIEQNIWQNIEQNICQNIKENIEQNIRQNIGENKIEYNSFAWYANIGDYVFMSYYDYLITEKMIPDNQHFQKFKSLLESRVYDMIQFKNFCLVAAFPETLKRGERNRLHSEIEPAVKWKDGFELYYLNGISLEKNLWQKIVSKTISAKEAITLKNSEHRTLAINHIGFEKLVEECEAKTIGKDEYGEIIELNLKDINDSNYRYYKAIDPSKNEYVYLRTRPDVKTPKEAMTIAYRLGNLRLEYAPILRT